MPSMIGLARFTDGQMRCDIHPDRIAFYYDKENERFLCNACYFMYEKLFCEEYSEEYIEVNNSMAECACAICGRNFESVHEAGRHIRFEHGDIDR